MSIPQLRADINRLQAELSAAHARIAELESKPETIREVKVPFDTVRIEYRERPVEVVKIEYRDRVTEPVTVYVDNPEHIATIAALQAIIRGRE